MALNAAQAKREIERLRNDARTEWARLNRYVRYARGRQRLPWLPDSAESEYRDIAKKSASNWLELVVRSTAQGLHVDGYGAASDDSEPSSLWDEVWQPNGMDARQHALHRAVLTLGYSYLIEWPADDGGVWMRPEAATSLFAVYDDPGDDWPTLALREVKKGAKGSGKGGIYELYDAEARYTLRDGKVAIAEHDLGLVPVVKVESQLDLLGDPQGEIEPVIPIQDRIVDATFTLQMVAKYGAFPQRWIAGLNPQAPLTDPETGEPVTDEAGNFVYPNIKAYVDSILTASDNDTKFGQFAAADLRQYVEALEAHIRHLAAITQTPPHYLLGSLVNLSAEALAAAEAGLQRKIRDRREVIGEGYEQAFRLAATILGDIAAAEDMSAQVHWQDVESRSLAQVADALTKLATIGVPLQMLLRMIPGWTQQDVEEAADLIESDDVIGRLVSDLEAGASPRQEDPAAIKAKADAMGVLIRSGVEPLQAAQQAGLGDLQFTGAVPTSLRLPQAEAADLEGG